MQTINRTIEELKLPRSLGGILSSSSINRTIEELKSERQVLDRSLVLAINRTIEELKCAFSKAHLSLISPLIAP